MNLANGKFGAIDIKRKKRMCKIRLTCIIENDQLINQKVTNFNYIYIYIFFFTIACHSIQQVMGHKIFESFIVM